MIFITNYHYFTIVFSKDIIKSPHKLFDVMFVEVLTMYQCFLPLARKLEIPVIGVVAQRSWLYADIAVNNPNNPSFIPSTMRTYWKNNAFIERVVNTLFYAMKIFLRVNNFEPTLSKFYEDHEHYFGRLSASDLPGPTLIFSNGNPVILPRPLNPNFIEIGGIHIPEEKPLPIVRLNLFFLFELV